MTKYKKVSRKSKTLKNKTSKRYLKMYGGTRHTVEMSEVMLGIPVTLKEAGSILKLLTRVDISEKYPEGIKYPTTEEINAHLKRDGTQLRITVIGKGTYLLGYYLANLSDISIDEHKDGLKPINGVINELQTKSSMFKGELKRLNPMLAQVTLTPVESDAIDMSIDDLEPYLFSTSQR